MRAEQQFSGAPAESAISMTLPLMSTALLCKIGALSLTILCLLGCVPALMAADVIAGAAAGNARSSPVSAPGLFGSRPPASQTVPSSDKAMGENLEQADVEEMTDACRALLPPQEPLPVSGCENRLTCLPGSQRPIRLRLCVSLPEQVQSVRLRPYRLTWAW